MVNPSLTAHLTLPRVNSCMLKWEQRLNMPHPTWLILNHVRSNSTVLWGESDNSQLLRLCHRLKSLQRSTIRELRNFRTIRRCWRLVTACSTRSHFRSSGRWRSRSLSLSTPSPSSAILSSATSRTPRSTSNLMNVSRMKVEYLSLAELMLKRPEWETF